MNLKLPKIFFGGFLCLPLVCFWNGAFCYSCYIRAPVQALVLHLWSFKAGVRNTFQTPANSHSMRFPNMATITTPFHHKPTHQESLWILSVWDIFILYFIELTISKPPKRKRKWCCSIIRFGARMKIVNSHLSKELVTVYGQIRGLCGSIKLTRCHSSAG